MSRISALLKDCFGLEFPAAIRAGGGGSGSGRRKFVLNMSEKSAASFLEMKGMTDTDSDSEVVRNALRLHAYLLRQHQSGAKVFLRSTEGENPVEVSLFVDVPADTDEIEVEQSEKERDDLMKTKSARFSVEITGDHAEFLASAAKSEGVSESEILRRAFSILIAYDRQIKLGRTHLGFAADPSGLDCELTGVFNNVAT